MRDRMVEYTVLGYLISLRLLPPVLPWLINARDPTILDNCQKDRQAMNIEAPETKIVDSYRIACDGGEGGHPRVWLQIPDEHGWVECPYCNCKFVHKDHQGQD